MNEQMQELQNTLGTKSTHKLWFLPILRVLYSLGGSSSPKIVREGVRVLLGDRITDSQWARATAGYYLGWARNSLRQIGLLTGERGTWQLTPLAKEYLEFSRGFELESFELVREADEGSVLLDDAVFTRFHIRLTSSSKRKRVAVQRTTVSISKCLAGLLALKLKAEPETEEAHRVVREWIQQRFDELDDPSRPYKSQWVQDEIIMEIVESKLTRAYLNTFYEQ